METEVTELCKDGSRKLSDALERMKEDEDLWRKIYIGLSSYTCW